MFSSKITTAAIGAAGFTASSLVGSTEAFDTSILTQAVEIIVQIIIAVVTLLGLFKKKN